MANIVIVGVDGTESSRAAARRAAEMAAATGARLHVRLCRQPSASSRTSRRGQVASQVDLRRDRGRGRRGSGGRAQGQGPGDLDQFDAGQAGCRPCRGGGATGSLADRRRQSSVAGPGEGPGQCGQRGGGARSLRRLHRQDGVTTVEIGREAQTKSNRFLTTCKMSDILQGMSEHVAVVTGGGRGLGEAIARDLAKAGARVVHRRALASSSSTASRSSSRTRAARRSSGRPTSPTPQSVAAALRRGGRSVRPARRPRQQRGHRHPAQPRRPGRGRVGAHLRHQRARACSCAAARQAARSRRSARAARSTSPRCSGCSAGPGFSAYCASKGAVINFTRAVAAEWARFGAQMNAVAPGLLRHRHQRRAARRRRGDGRRCCAASRPTGWATRTSWPTSSPTSRCTPPTSSPARPSRSTVESRASEPSGLQRGHDRSSHLRAGAHAGRPVRRHVQGRARHAPWRSTVVEGLVDRTGITGRRRRRRHLRPGLRQRRGRGDRSHRRAGRRPRRHGARASRSTGAAARVSRRCSTPACRWRPAARTWCSRAARRA